MVVNPEIDSKMASVIDRSGASDKNNGSEPKAPNTNQNNAVIKKPSRVLNVCLIFRLGSQSPAPVAAVIAKADKKT